MKIRTINNHNKAKRKLHFQAGLSLIELMISITLGAFLIAGVATNFIGSKKSDKTRAAISEMDANARAAISILRQTIQHAGYPSSNNIRLEKAFYTPSDELTNPTCRDGVSRDKTPPSWSHRTRDSGLTDIITVIMLADNPCLAGSATCAGDVPLNEEALIYYDCVGGGADRSDTRVSSCSTDPIVGMSDPTQAKIYSTFWVSRDHDLYCHGSRGNTQPLVQNIEYMQILYGVKQANGQVSYRKANDVESADQWGQVISVQIALLVRSSSDVLEVPSSKIWYTLLDVRREVETADLRHLFRVYTTTINLANINKGALL